MKTTIRQWLNEAGFNWGEGKIVYQESGWDNSEWGFVAVSARMVQADDVVLDSQFDPYLVVDEECPRFIARDDKYLYFPVRSVGAAWLYRVAFGIEYYLDVEHLTPYPGEL